MFFIPLGQWIFVNVNYANSRLSMRIKLLFITILRLIRHFKGITTSLLLYIFRIFSLLLKSDEVGQPDAHGAFT